MKVVIEMILMILDLYSWVVISSVILSWLVSLKIVNIYNPIVNSFSRAITQLTEPVFSFFRKFIPYLGPVDLSPVAVFFTIIFIQKILTYYVYPYVF